MANKKIETWTLVPIHLQGSSGIHSSVRALLQQMGNPHNIRQIVMMSGLLSVYPRFWVLSKRHPPQKQRHLSSISPVRKTSHDIDDNDIYLFWQPWLRMISINQVELFFSWGVCKHCTAKDSSKEWLALRKRDRQICFNFCDVFVQATQCEQQKITHDAYCIMRFSPESNKVEFGGQTYERCGAPSVGICLFCY